MMVSRKLKHFEFAGSQEQGSTGPVSHLQKSFETPNGFVLVVCCCDSDQQEAACNAATAIERIGYYLENEVPEDPREAVGNALIYANGYLFEQQRKSQDPSLPVSCLCLLIQGQKVFYSWAGEVSLFLAAGRRWVPLIGQTGQYLGMQKVLTAETCEQPLQPLDDDLILMGSGPLINLASNRHARKVLLDNMPAQTKVTRLIRILDDHKLQDGVALQLVRFYNMEHEQRAYETDQPVEAPSVAGGSLVQGLFQTPASRKMLKTAGAILASLLIGYMVYDLFIYDAQPVTQVVSAARSQQETNDSAATGEVPVVQVSQPVLPADVEYVVKRGDTWGKIYGQFEVCSWFIRNHPPNSSLFENTEDPVVGTRLMIPVSYSASSSLNPAYYQEFSLDRVGSSCQNAGEEFLEDFEEKISG